MMLGPYTYILPDLPWDILLDGILHDAPAGAVIEVHTEPMHELVERRLAEAGRTDLVLRLKIRNDAPKGQAT
jgi:hypothetical protein